MACVHLQELFQLCQNHDLKVSGADLVHFVCEKCNRQEVCPMSMMERQEEMECLEASAQLSPSTSETLASEATADKTPT